MFHHLTGRAAHYLSLLLIGAALFFPHLGTHSLWDVDESHNAECAREMMEADNWQVPTFNFALRTDKPALLYWLMIAAYQLFGVTEFAARFWSVFSGLGSVFVTYEIGRRMFDARTGLLAGLVLGSAVMFCISAHAATPDALLIFFSTLTFCLFWHGYGQKRPSWLVWIGVSCGFAVLAKGPVGLLLPATTIGWFLLWERRLHLLWNRRLVVGIFLFAAIALPWYIIVGVETKWKFFWDTQAGQGFFLKHNVGRFLSPLERHGGSILYHPLALLAAFAPWSAFLGLTLWYGTGRRARSDARASPRADEAASSSSAAVPIVSGYRFLWCWALVWIAFFSIAGTKLPNYLLPAYPAFALLTARFLTRWQADALQVPAWAMKLCLACLALIGLVVTTGLLLASGTINLTALRGRELPSLAPWAIAGLIPIGAAVLAWRCLRPERRLLAVQSLAAGSVTFIALLAGVGPPAVDAYKLPKALAAEIARHQVEPEVRIGCYEYYQPGLVFYARREVQRLPRAIQAVDLLHSPLQTFLVVPAQHWERLRTQVETPHCIVARRRDFTTGEDILLITNRGRVAG